MLAYRMNAGIGVLDGCLYVVGGDNGNGVLNAVECFDPDKNVWTLKTEMNKCRQKLNVSLFLANILQIESLSEGFIENTRMFIFLFFAYLGCGRKWLPLCYRWRK